MRPLERDPGNGTPSVLSRGPGIWALWYRVRRDMTLTPPWKPKPRPAKPVAWREWLRQWWPPAPNVVMTALSITVAVYFGVQTMQRDAARDQERESPERIRARLMPMTWEEIEAEARRRLMSEAMRDVASHSATNVASRSVTNVVASHSATNTAPTP